MLWKPQPPCLAVSSTEENWQHTSTNSKFITTLVTSKNWNNSKCGCFWEDELSCPMQVKPSFDTCSIMSPYMPFPAVTWKKKITIVIVPWDFRPIIFLFLCHLLPYIKPTSMLRKCVLLFKELSRYIL